MAEIDIKPLPPQEAVAFFRRKGYAYSFSWKDIWTQEHARAFTVAKAMRVDILQDIRQEVDRALAEGTTFEQFRAALTPKLQAKGWWGRQAMTDPNTGERIVAQLGSPRRLRIIYDTNLRMARSAGRWEAAQRLKGSRPYLRYTAVMDSRTRPEHRAWHNIVRPVDDDFWRTHYPPNGWNCRCIVQSLNDRDLARLGLKVSPPQSFKTRRYVNQRAGVVADLPEGIDPGFGYNVGNAGLRGVTPSPLSGDPMPIPPDINPPATDAALMPRRRPASWVLPEQTSIPDAIHEFTKHLGGTGGQALFVDVIGEMLIADDNLFRNDKGEYKILKRGRLHYVKFLAESIKDPDEIWYYWDFHKERQQWRLVRRYIGRYEVPGESAPAVSMFELSRDGWRGVTGFRADSNQYLENQRRGRRVYRRQEP